MELDEAELFFMRLFNAQQRFRPRRVTTSARDMLAVTITRLHYMILKLLQLLICILDPLGIRDAVHQLLLANVAGTVQLPTLLDA